MTPLNSFTGLWMTPVPACFGTIRERINPDLSPWMCRWVARAEFEIYFGKLERIGHLKQIGENGTIFESMLVAFQRHILILADAHRWSMSLLVPRHDPLVAPMLADPVPLQSEGRQV